MKLFFVAGEPSGDAHAADVIGEILKIRPDAEIHAYGGERMKAAGAKIHFDLTSLSSIGLDWVRNIRTYSRLIRQAPLLCRELGIRDVVLVDYPGFNLRVATRAHQSGLAVRYYISPQVWAWRTGRVKRMKRDLKKVFVILPFEEEFLQQRGVPARFVGHPLVDRLKERRSPGEIRASAGLPLSEEIPLAGLLPGSRPREVQRLGPVLYESARLLLQRFPNLHFVVPRSDSITAEEIRQVFRQDIPWTLVENPSPDLRSAFRVSLTKSGTSTLENALLGIPQVVLYKVKPLDAWIARRVIRIPWIGLVNILAGREICPECLQEDCTPENIAKKAIPLIEDTPQRTQMLEDLRKVAASLGEGRAARRTAEALIEDIEGV